MFVHNVRGLVHPLWALLVLFTFLVAHAPFAASTVPLAFLAIALPLIVLAPWRNGPPLAVAEVVRTVEQQS